VYITVADVTTALEKIKKSRRRNHGGNLLDTKRKLNVIVAGFEPNTTISYWYIM